VVFCGWPAEALEFFAGLAADNSKAYWTAHKTIYAELVHPPMVALLDELAPEFGPGRVLRPYRDIRFSIDKSPYRTSIAAGLFDGGYVRLSADGLGVGRGKYQLAPDQLARYRAAVADAGTGGELAALVAALQARQIAVTAHDTLKTAPRGYPKDHPRIVLLRHKGLVAWREWPAAEWMGTAAVKDRVAEFLRAAEPLQHWLDGCVGPSMSPR
jgi:uncharacterized protein (TIGR02453 family)